MTAVVLKGALNQHHRMIDLVHQIRRRNRPHLDQIGFMRAACPFRKARAAARELDARDASSPIHLDFGLARPFRQIDEARRKRRLCTHRHQAYARVEIAQNGFDLVREAFIEHKKRRIDRVRQKGDFS